MKQPPVKLDVQDLLLEVTRKCNINHPIAETRGLHSTQRS